MGIAPRIVRRGVATAPAAPAAKPETPAQDLAAELTTDNSTVVEIPEEEVAEGIPAEEAAPAPAPAPAKKAAAAPATNVAAALDKAAKEQKKFSPIPKKVTINKAKETKEPEEGDRITRDWMFEKYFEYLQTNPGDMDFSGITKAQARRHFEANETFIQNIIEKYEVLVLGMLFKHQEKTGSFREPKDVIFYNGPHLEIVGRKVFPGVTAALQVVNGKVKIGKVKEGVAEDDPDKIVEDAELAKIVLPEYKKHLEKTVNRLDADDAKAAARAAKLQERGAALLK